MNTEEPAAVVTVKDITRLMLRTYQRHQKGLLDTVQAQKEITLLKGILDAVKVTELEKRVEFIETWKEEE
jgi:hypothetical protein